MPNALLCGANGSALLLINSLWHGELKVCRMCGKIRAPYQCLKAARATATKDPADRSPKTMNFPDHRGRLRAATGILRDAHSAVSGEADDPAARRPKQQTLTRSRP